MTAQSTLQGRTATPQLLNLGCGTDYREGWHNVDVSEEVRADEYHDLDDRPWPWPDDSFVRVSARHVLEHLDDPLAACREIARVLVAGGQFVLTYPIGHTRWEDPTHQHYWTTRTAPTLAGDGAHPHELELPFRLTDRSVDVSVAPATIGRRLRLWYLRRRHGVGPWLDTFPGAYGEVTAVYTREDA